MKYEECSRSLLQKLSVAIDPDREGTVIDVGVGTSDYYFIDLSQQGFRTLAVEPLPSPDLLATCRARVLELEVACISDVDGLVDLYLGVFSGRPDSNLSSLRPDWWGSSTKARQVPSLRLGSLLVKHKIERITILKLDTEGSEATIIRSLKDISSESLPSIIQFEYGGGGTKQDQRAGWAPKYFADICESLRVLQSLAYEWLLLVDRDLPNVKSFWLPEINDFEEIFHPLSHVGNAIVCRDGSLRNKFDIAKLCQPFVDYPRSLVRNLLHLGSDESTHSFKWVLPYVIAHQYETKKRALRVLEYGPGCNSEQFINSLVCEHLVSVEDNVEWYAKYAPIFSDADVRVDYQLIEVRSSEGKEWCGGHCWTEEEILPYVNYPLKYGAGYFDIIFIDSGDRQDLVTIKERTYKGWPIRNLSLELAHSLLNENGVAVIHDFPSPFHALNVAISQNVRSFKNVLTFDEFYTSVLSDYLNLAPLEREVRQAFGLGLWSRLIVLFLRRIGLSWYRSKVTKALMKLITRIYDSSSPNS